MSAHLDKARELLDSSYKGLNVKALRELASFYISLAQAEALERIADRDTNRTISVTLDGKTLTEAVHKTLIKQGRGVTSQRDGGGGLVLT